MDITISKEDRKKAVEYHMNKIISAMGLDADSTHLKDTPKRVAKMFIDEIFGGLYEDAPRITEFEETDPDKNHGLVMLGSIDVFSTCSHHFKAFTGKAHIAYIPKGKLVGISKFARVTDWLARRPQVQENLGNSIADYFMEMIEPHGVGVAIEAVHNCIRVRGAKQSSSIMFTDHLRGVFLDNADVRQEFWNKINRLPKVTI